MNKKKRLNTEEFNRRYDKIRNSTKHPNVSYKLNIARTKGQMMEFDSHMPPNKESNFGSE